MSFNSQFSIFRLTCFSFLPFAFASLLTAQAPNSVFKLGPPITTVPLPNAGPVGIAVSPTQLLVSLNGCSTVDSVDSSGKVTLFATLPGGLSSGICESYLAISPGLGGFTGGDVFVTQGNLVYEYTPLGALVRTLIVGPSVPLNISHTGITFDSVGAFGNRMIVTIFDSSSDTTSIYAVDSAGTSTFLTKLAGEVEGPDVVPLNGGQLWVAEAAPGNQVIEIDQMGNQVGVFSPDAEAVRYIPPSSCTFGSTGSSYFQAEYFPNTIVGYSPAQLSAAGAVGRALVPTEFNTDIYAVPYSGLASPVITVPINARGPGGVQQTEGNAVCVTPSPTTTMCTIPPSGTAIPGSPVSWNKFNAPTASTVWIHAHIGTPSGVPTNSVTTVQFTGVTFVLNGITYNLPNGEIVFDPAAPSTPSTTFDSTNGWITTVNPNHLSDEIFFDGNGFPVDANISGGGKATFNYTTISNDNNLAFSWQWSAAVFTYWPGNSAANILASHASDHAGTPENATVQKSLIQGPRGGGGSNFTGSWSGTGHGSCPK